MTKVIYSFLLTSGISTPVPEVGCSHGLSMSLCLNRTIIFHSTVTPSILCTTSTFSFRSRVLTDRWLEIQGAFTSSLAIIHTEVCWAFRDGWSSANGSCSSRASHRGLASRATIIYWVSSLSSYHRICRVLIPFRDSQDIWFSNLMCHHHGIARLRQTYHPDTLLVTLLWLSPAISGATYMYATWVNEGDRESIRRVRTAGSMLCVISAITILERA